MAYRVTTTVLSDDKNWATTTTKNADFGKSKPWTNPSSLWTQKSTL